jgi:DNA invertase Pin-like site-specific DNA recombinase
MNAKIRPEHLARPAVVYIRQSTLLQVLEHQQSTERQYNLADLAKRLGWGDAQVQVIDEDLGLSGASAAQRTGFQKLAAEVSLGRVGAIFSLEVSRLARSSADWHRLLDLCALSDTLIVDDDGVYDPNDFNDRLVLGMKGTMSDAERHVMRLRLQGGKLHKARKGELAFPPPTGYVFDDGRLVFDPDDEVQKAVRLLFERFRLESSAYGVVRYFTRYGLLYPSRHAHKDAPAELRWRPLSHSRTLATLRSPFYAGAYAYGRRQQRRVLADGAVLCQRGLLVSREKWHTLLRDAHPGYITWEEHMENLRRLDENQAKRLRVHQRGAPRNGEALLQGLALCGKCGRRMHPVYRRDGGYVIYECSRRPDAAGTCWSVPNRHVDEKLVDVFLEAMAPPELDLSLAVLKEVEHQAADVDRQWKLRLDRARYEAGRAERQYNAVEPENRNVARTLEIRWNQKLEEMAQVEREHAEARRARKLELSNDDKKAILALAHDLKKVWNAPTTTPAEKKQLIRLIIQDVVLAPVDVPERATRLKVLWKTGAVTEVLAARPTSGCKTPDNVLAIIRELAGRRRADVEIAEELNRRGLKSGRGRSFTKQAVTMLRSEYKISAGRPPGGHLPMPDRDELGRLSIRALAARYAVTTHVVRYWVETDVVTPERDYQGGPFWFALTPAVEARIADALQRGYGPRKRRPLRRPTGSRQTAEPRRHSHRRALK